MVPLIKPYLQMACETFSFADELFCILDCGHIHFFGRLEQNWFNHLYESEEENPSPAFRATKVGKLLLQGSILYSRRSA